MQRHSKFVGRQFATAAVDILLLHCSFLAAFYVRFGLDLQTKLSYLHNYVQISTVLSACAVVIIHFSGLYDNWLRKSKSFLVQSAGAASAMIVLVAIVLCFVERAFAFPRTVFVIAFALLALLLAVSRLFVQHLYRNYSGSRRVLIIARDAEAAFTLIRKFSKETGWYHVEKVLTVDQLAWLPSILPEVDTVAIGEMLEDKIHIFGLCIQAGKQVLVVPAVSELLLFNSRTQQIDDLLLFSVNPPTLSGPQRAIKRVFDLAVSAVLSVLVSPLLLLAYVMIRIDSPGPVIYMQERVGLGGKIFNVFKFRSMKLDAEEHSGPVLACEQDPRITKVGRFLRASRIDELPQLLNVMLGEMSFVGPRPERLVFVEQFAAKNPDYLLRLNVKPGITGLAQIWGKYSTAVEDKLRLDLIYTANYSPILDFNIILHTLRVVLLRANAEGIQQSSGTRLMPEDQVTVTQGWHLATAGVVQTTPAKDC